MNRNAQDLAMAELRAAIESQSTRLTELSGLLRGLSLNEVLRSETIVLGSSGVAERHTSAPYASVGVWALDGDTTVTSAPAGDTAPTEGIGVIVVPAGGAIVWPLTGTSLTVYGTSADRVLVTLWGKPQCPMVAGVGAPTP